MVAVNLSVLEAAIHVTCVNIDAEATHVITSSNYETLPMCKHSYYPRTKRFKTMSPRHKFQISNCKAVSYLAARELQESNKSDQERWAASFNLGRAK